MSDELVFGYFYQLHLVLKSYQCIGQTSRWIISDFVPPGDKQVVGAECAYAEVSSYEQRDRHDCPIDKAHVSCEVIIPTLVDLFSGPSAPFIPNFSDGLVNEQLAEQLKASGLKNVEVRPVELTEDPRGPQQKVFALIFNGPEIFRLGWQGPEEKNVCPFCGFGPLFCRACKAGHYFCPRCKEQTTVSPSDRKVDDRRIVIEQPENGPIIDPRLWDGSDFCGGSCGTITRRALDWLLSVHAAPFRAQPLRTDVSGLTAEQSKFLETAKEPVKTK
jgi:hypothetical protein